MGYQFLHVNVYSRRAGKGKAGGQDVRGIIDEVTRAPEASAHVPDPQPHELVFGCSPLDIPLMCDEYAATMTSTHERKNRKTGKPEQVTRKMREDGLVLMAGVFSCPSEMPIGTWEEYRDRMVEKLKDEFGDRLKSVVQHNDEKHPHCHFYIIPRPGESLDKIHVGRQALKNGHEQGLSKSKRDLEYMAAMRQWQDSYWNDVSKEFGLARLGPRRQRLNRDEYNAQQHANKQMALAMREAKEQQEQATKQLAQAAQDLAKAEKVLAQARAARKEADQVIERVSTWGGRIGTFVGAAVSSLTTASAVFVDYLRERGLWPGMGKVQELQQQAQQDAKAAQEKRRQADADRDNARLERARATEREVLLRNEVAKQEGLVNGLKSRVEVLGKHNKELEQENKDLSAKLGLKKGHGIAD